MLSTLGGGLLVRPTLLGVVFVILLMMSASVRALTVVGPGREGRWRRVVVGARVVRGEETAIDGLIAEVVESSIEIFIF